MNTEFWDATDKSFYVQSKGCLVYTIIIFLYFQLVLISRAIRGHINDIFILEDIQNKIISCGSYLKCDRVLKLIRGIA